MLCKRRYLWLYNSSRTLGVGRRLPLPGGVSPTNRSFRLFVSVLLWCGDGGTLPAAVATFIVWTCDEERFDYSGYMVHNRQ
jgi:hypothetical protein